MSRKKRDVRFFENWFSGDGHLIDMKKELEKKKKKEETLKKGEKWSNVEYMRTNPDFVCVLIRSWVQNKDFIPDDTIDETLEFLFYMGFQIGVKESEENE